MNHHEEPMRNDTNRHEEPMRSSDARDGVQAVEAFYGNLAAGRLDAALALLANDASWNDPEGFPYGGRLSGAGEVKTRVFEPIAADWASFAVQVERVVPSADGSSVLALGRYAGRHRTTSRTLDAPFAHVWSTFGGALTRFETYTDTAAIRDAMSAPEAGVRLGRAGRVLRAIAIGGAVVGVLDAADGVVYFRLTAGWDPIRVLQYIGSGALGPTAFSGGLASAGLGALIHFGLAYGFSAAFVLAWTRLRAIRDRWAIAGVAWGALVWAFMNLLVLPLTRVAPSPITPLSAVHGVLGHALFVGLSVALVARRLARPGVEAS